MLVHLNNAQVHLGLLARLLQLSEAPKQQKGRNSLSSPGTWQSFKILTAIPVLLRYYLHTLELTLGTGWYWGYA